MPKKILCLLFLLQFSTLWADTTSLNGHLLKEDCQMAKHVLAMHEDQRNDAPLETLVRARECLEFMQGIYGGISFSNITIVMQHPNLSSDALAKRGGICLPSLSNDDFIHALEHFFTAHPTQLNEPREKVAGEALREAYPSQLYCTKEYYEHIRHSPTGHDNY